MAKTVNGDLVVFDAVGQGEGFGPWLDTFKSVYEPEGTVPAMGSETVVYNVPLQVKQFKIVTGSGGDVLIYSRKVVGTADPTEENRPNERQRYEVLFLDATPANDTLWVDMDQRVDGLYIETLPTNAKIYVFLGDK